MKRVCCMMLALLLLLGGCHASDLNHQPTGGTTETTVPTMVTVPKHNLTDEPDGTALSMGQSGAFRVDYSGNVSMVRYISDASQLPGYAELSQFDDAYFQEHALLIVMETVTNGSVQVGISQIRSEGGQAHVTLSHEAPGDMATTVMTTWLVWVQVEKGLDLTWHVENPALEPSNEAY